MFETSRRGNSMDSDKSNAVARVEYGRNRLQSIVCVKAKMALKFPRLWPLAKLNRLQPISTVFHPSGNRPEVVFLSWSRYGKRALSMDRACPMLGQSIPVVGNTRDRPFMVCCRHGWKYLESISHTSVGIHQETTCYTPEIAQKGNLMGLLWLDQHHPITLCDIWCC